jgi:hypothetical protein
MIFGLISIYVTGWQPVFAGTLTKSMILEYNMVASQTTNIAISFTSATSGGTNVSVNLANLSTSLTASPTVSGGTCNTSPFTSGTPINGSSVSDGSGIVTFTSSVTFVASTTYCTIITASGGLMTNPAAGTYTATITAGSDSQTQGLDVISSDTYTVNGIIAQTFTMSILNGTDNFSSGTGTLSATSLGSTGGDTITVNTNALSGWLLWAADANAGLKSSTTGHTIGSVSTSSNVNMNSKIGQDAFALGVYSVTAGSATTPYADSGGTTGAGLAQASTTGYNLIATDSAPAASDAVVVKEMADILATDQASNDYNDTITILGAGSF